MADKGTEISIGKEGFSFKTDGEASERLANAALDFLSPITEGAGWLGTKLRGYRMEAALNATIRAKEICEENNLPINPVPPKFLLQWVEGASMEDVNEEENLIELWANLLASSAEGFSSGHLLYARILKEMTPAEAHVLKHIIFDTQENFQGERAEHCIEAIDNWGIVFSSNNWFDDEKHDDVEKHLLAAFRQLSRPGTLVEYLSFTQDTDDGGMISWDEYNDFFTEKDSESFYLLESLNLLKRMEKQGVFYRLNYHMFGVGFSTTRIAVDFCRACGIFSRETK